MLAPGFNWLAFQLEQTLQEACVLMGKPRPVLFLGLESNLHLWEVPPQAFLTAPASLSSPCRLAVGDPLRPGIPVLLLPRGHCLGPDLLHEVMPPGQASPCCRLPTQMVLLPDLMPQDNRQGTSA